MKFLLILLSISFVLGLNAQKELRLKRRNFETYVGTIPSYKFDNGAEILEVTAAQIEIEVTAENVRMLIGKEEMLGIYKILFEGSDYYVLEAFFEGEEIPERLVVYKKKKKLIREGIYPQPNTILLAD